MPFHRPVNPPNHRRACPAVCIPLGYKKTVSSTSMALHALTLVWVKSLFWTTTMTMPGHGTDWPRASASLRLMRSPCLFRRKDFLLTQFEEGFQLLSHSFKRCQQPGDQVVKQRIYSAENRCLTKKSNTGKRLNSHFFHVLQKPCERKESVKNNKENVHISPAFFS